ncbi:hypothetical protein Tco_1467330 [Tanacetum coccineum]
MLATDDMLNGDHLTSTENSPAIPEQTTVETVLNMSPANKAHFESEKEAIHLILTGIGDEIYSTVDACKIAHEMWETSYRRLLQGESLTSKDFKTNLFWECLSIHLSAMEKQFEVILNKILQDDE